MMYVFVYVLSCCFFKQKTAYEMRISDWSSDVCSSDLIDDNRRPDLGALLSACRTVGRALRPGAVVVFESTVYPGVTEEICGPALAEASRSEERRGGKECVVRVDLGGRRIIKKKIYICIP